MASSESPDPAAAVAAVVATMREVLAPIQEAAIGYRRTLIEAGFDSDTANMMAAEFHHVCFDRIEQGLGKR